MAHQGIRLLNLSTEQEREREAQGAARDAETALQAKEKAMKLYVDDLRKEPEGWHRAKTVTEAIRILATREIEEVSIDHDISHAIGMDKIARRFPCGETFEPVAWFLAIKFKRVQEFCAPTTFFPKITLHTANPIGAKKMKAILNDAGLECEVKLGQPVNGLE